MPTAARKQPPESFSEEELAALPLRLRQVMSLRQEGWSHEEIAQELGLASAQSVATYVSQGRMKIYFQRRNQGVAQPANDGSDEAPGAPPAVAKLRDRNVLGHRRSLTISGTRLSRAEREAGELIEYPVDVERPQSREECANMPRPCPFVSCAHHLYLDVNPDTGSIKLNFPHLEPWEMGETCALDVADRGGITLEEVGAILNLTRERIRQVEVSGLYKIRNHSGEALGIK
jgi:hypothetical protein